MLKFWGLDGKGKKWDEEGPVHENLFQNADVAITNCDINYDAYKTD